jgi:hypothetical protein
VEHHAAKHLAVGALCPYNTIIDYQRFVSAIAYASVGPPCTMVSKDGMAITYGEWTLHIPQWRMGIAKLFGEVEAEIDALCGLLTPDIPSDVPDNWTEMLRGYSWLDNGNFFPEERMLLKELFRDTKLQLGVVGRDGKLIINMEAVRKILESGSSINRKLAILSFICDGQDPRMAEFIDHKHRNSLRPRTCLRSHGELWFVTRRVKTENLAKHETFIPIKCNPRLQKLMEKYLLLIRPVEQDFSELLWGKNSAELYAEYLYMELGHRMTERSFSDHLRFALGSYCGCKVSGQPYRQITVEIARVFLGSEHEMDEEELDVIAAQRGHKSATSRRIYAIEVNHLPCLSSDLLLRYGRASEAWWEVVGVKPNVPPMLPLCQRRLISQQAACPGPAYSSSAFNQNEVTQAVTATILDEMQKMKENLYKQVQQSVAAGVAEIMARGIYTSASSAAPTISSSLMKSQMLQLPPVEPAAEAFRMDIEDIYAGGTDSAAVHVQQSTDHLRDLLCRFYNNPDADFKSPEQRRMLEIAVTRSANFLGILPTGGGKSLVFLLPALQEEGFYTYVVEPNKVLLNDQLQKATKYGIQAMQWTTSTLQVPAHIRILFLALETAASPAFRK